MITPLIVALFVFAIVAGFITVRLFGSLHPARWCQRTHRKYWLTASHESYRSTDNQVYYAAFHCRLCNRTRYRMFYRCEHPSHPGGPAYYGVHPDDHDHELMVDTFVVEKGENK